MYNSPALRWGGETPPLPAEGVVAVGAGSPRPVRSGRLQHRPKFRRVRRAFLRPMGLCTSNSKNRESGGASSSGDLRLLTFWAACRAELAECIQRRSTPSRRFRGAPARAVGFRTGSYLGVAPPPGAEVAPPSAGRPRSVNVAANRTVQPADRPEIESRAVCQRRQAEIHQHRQAVGRTSRLSGFRSRWKTPRAWHRHAAGPPAGRRPGSPAAPAQRRLRRSR